MSDVVTVVAELATRESFAPFGHVLSVEGLERLPINLYEGLDVFRPATIDAEAPIEWLVQRSGARDFRVLYLERHMLLSQAFIPLANAPLVAVVAPAATREEQGFPALEEVRAFLVPGDRGIQLDVGVWHEPPFGLTEGSQVLMTSHRSLTRGLGAALDGRREIAQLDVEKRNLFDRTGKVLKVLVA